MSPGGALFYGVSLMGRIRTIKPEFWDDDKVGSLSVYARLTFIATWNLADDEGLLRWNAAYIKAQVFPYDDEIDKGKVDRILEELENAGLVFKYRDARSQYYGWILNFRKHQRIDKPQSAKHPLPSIQSPAVKQAYAIRDGWICQICRQEIIPKKDEQTTWLSLDHIKPRSAGGQDYPSNLRISHFGCNASKKDRDDSVAFLEHSDNEAGMFDPERNGREDEGNGKGREEEGEGANAPVADATPDCPHSEIVGLYHSLCPSLPRVRDWTDGRRKALRTLWRDKPERQRIEFWHEFFAVVGRSPFLVGANDRNWTADIDWLLKPANFQKVLEGKYEARPQERFSKTTQSNLKAVEGFLSAINGR